jgi:O-acetylserine/cysteine efflux transporter
MTPYYALISIAIMAIWGMNFVFFAIANTDIPLFTMMTLRFGIVALCLVPFFRKPPAPLWLIALTAFIFAIPHAAANFGGIALGLDAGMAALVEQTNAPFLLLLNVLFYKERIGIRSMTGVALSIIGTFFLMQAPTSMAAPLGFSLVLCGAFFWGVYSLLLKRIGVVKPLAIIGWMALFAAPINGILALIFEENHFQTLANADSASWLVVGYMVVVASFGAHAMWYYLIDKVPMDQLAPTTLLIPLFSVIGGVLLLDEHVSVETLIGGAIITLGVAVVLIRRPKTYGKNIGGADN